MENAEPGERLKNFLLLQLENGQDEEYLYNLAGRLRGRVFDNIMVYVKKRLSCKSVLVEEDYIDVDYRNEFSNLYSKTFQDHGSLCTRLHFFGKRIKTIEDLRNFSVSSETVGYLGFAVLRPVNVGKVGRTILRSHHEPADAYYPLCTADFSAHLFGREFLIENACPFISQDSMVMACAQSSIWMASLYLHKKFGFRRFLPYEITENASKSLSWLWRAVPTEGLTVFQMINALNNMGMSPILLSKPIEKDYPDKDQYLKDKKEWDPVDFIYSYVESRIPVLVSVPEHAVTVIGHTFNPHSARLKKKIEEKRREYADDLKKTGSSEVKLVFPSHTFVSGFIIQDDGRGPYRILPIEESDCESFQDSTDLLPAEGCAYRTLDDIEHIIVPLPEKIYLSGKSAYRIAEQIFQSTEIMQLLAKSLDQGNQHAEEMILGREPGYEVVNPIIIRCYFMDSSEFKKAIALKNLDPVCHEQVRTQYLEMRLPHYIWIAEITTANRFCQTTESQRSILGEILIDSTANRYDPANACLSVHLPGFMLLRNLEKRVFDPPKFFERDIPYRHITRRLTT